MAGRTFEQWVQCIFDHPVREPEWFWVEDVDHCIEDDGVNVAYLTRLFRESADVLRRFTDAQVDQGLNFVAHSACSDHLCTLLASSVEERAVQACIDAIYELNANLFAARCEPNLSHLDLSTNPLNRVCYMWWDLWPGRGCVERRDVPRATTAMTAPLAVMERCLSLPNIACVEGALHGLGHWQRYWPDRVKPILDEFLKQHSGDRPDLLEYARNARRGRVL